MAALDFPASPSSGQRYSANGSTWEWNGSAWIKLATSSGPTDQVTTANDISTAALYPVMVDGAGDNKALKVSTSKLKFDASAGGLTVISGVGTVTAGIGSTALIVDGDARVLGILTVGSGTVKIDGAGITASGIVTSTEGVTISSDSKHLKIGAHSGGDLLAYHDGNKSVIVNYTGDFHLRTNNGSRSSREGIILKPNGSSEIYYSGSKKIETTNVGAVVTGILTATDFSGTGGGAADFPNGLTGTTGNFTSDVTVGGVLTYEDVRNIDSVGIVTARAGIRVTGGNVNIGTGELTQTARKFNVYGGAARVTQTSGGNTIEAFGHSTSGQSYGLLVNAGSTSADYAAEFRNKDASTLLRIRGDGNVGIGIANPSNKLEISGGLVRCLGTASARFTANNGSAEGFIGFNSGTFHIGEAAATTQIAAAGANIISMVTNGDERLRITSAGKVLIGAGVTDYGSLNVDGSASFCDNGTNAGLILATDGTTGAAIHCLTTGSFQNGAYGTMRLNALQHSFTYGNTDRLFIKSNGHIGIGTNVPGEKLDVNGSLRLRASGNWTTYATRLTSRLDSTHMMSLEAYHNSSSPVEVLGTYADSGGSNMRTVIAANGMKVGIGTDDPDYNLEVIGSFAATTKSFVIDHPTKENHQLRYACLEGPENSVYVRGRSSDPVIELPDYWVGLVHDDSITVNVTPIGNKNVWVESINNNSVTIGSDDSTEYFYTVFAERKDVEKLEVEVEK